MTRLWAWISYCLLLPAIVELYRRWSAIISICQYLSTIVSNYVVGFFLASISIYKCQQLSAVISVFSRFVNNYRQLSEVISIYRHLPAIISSYQHFSAISITSNYMHLSEIMSSYQNLSAIIGNCQQWQLPMNTTDVHYAVYLVHYIIKYQLLKELMTMLELLREY